MRYYHYIAVAVGAVVMASRATVFSGHSWSYLLYLVGLGIFAWVGNALRRERNRHNAAIWRDEEKPLLKQALTTSRWERQPVKLLWGVVAVGACLLVGLVAWQIVGYVESHPASGLRTYKDSQYQFSFQYPATWKQGKSTTIVSGDRVTIFDPAGTKVGSGYVDQIHVNVQEVSADFPSQPTNEDVDSIVAQYKTAAPDTRLVGPLRQTAVGNMSGWTLTVSLTMDSLPFTSSNYWFLSNSRLYSVLVRAADKDWQADRPIFDSIISSFRAAS